MPIGEITKYEPTFEYVHVPAIAITFSILLLLYYFVIKGNPNIGTFLGNNVVRGGVTRTPDDNYLNYSGWYAAQYNADGAEAGYKTHTYDIYRPN
jgi:hypothetical protein